MSSKQAFPYNDSAEGDYEPVPAGIHDNKSSYLAVANSEYEHPSTGSMSRGHVALRGGLWRLLFDLKWHIISLLVTAVLLWMNFSNLFWFAVDFGANSSDSQSGVVMAYVRREVNPTNILAALQWAAKLHELLIGASIGSLVLFFTRRHLLGQGIQLGLMTQGYMTPSLDLLLDKVFWSALFHGHTIAFALMLLLSVIILTGAGPSSANLLIPSLNWWPLSNPFSLDVMPIYVHKVDTTNELWPTNISSALLSQGCDTGAIGLNLGCPSQDMTDLAYWAYSSNYHISSNLSIQEPRGRAERLLVATANTNGTAMVATTLTNNIVELYAVVSKFVANTDAGPVSRALDRQFTIEQPVQAPIVQVSCRAFDYDVARNTSTSDPSNYSNVIPSITTANFLPINGSSQLPGETIYLDGSIGQETWNFTQGPTTLNFTFVSTNTSRTGISLGAMVTWPYVLQNNDNPDGTSRTMLIPCAIDARWVPADTQFYPSSSAFITSNVSDPTVFISSGSLTASSPMNIDLDWAKALNIPFTYDNTTKPFMFQMLSMYNAGLQNINGSYIPSLKTDTPDSYNNITSFVETMISLVVADGLSTVNYDVAIGYLNASLDSIATSGVPINLDPNGQTADKVLQSLLDASWLYSFNGDQTQSMFSSFNINISQYGYGSGDRSALWWLGLVILLLHAVLVLYVVTFRLWLFFAGKEAYTPSSWQTVGDLLVLAINSRPPERSYSTSINIPESTWKLSVQIGDVGNSQVEMVVGDERVVQSLQIGKKYL